MASIPELVIANGGITANVAIPAERMKEGEAAELTVVEKALSDPEDEAFAFWARHCVPTIKSLLKNVGNYTPEEQLSHIRFVEEYIVPALGSKPERERARSLLTINGGPLETSVNVSDNGKPCVRFTIEPHMPDSDILEDSPIPGVARGVGADLGWFKQLAAELFPNQEEIEIMKTKMPKDSRSIPRAMTAFDLDGGDRSMKAYFYPVIKNMASGVNTDKVCIEAIKKLEPLGEAFVPALEYIQSYRQIIQPEKALITVLGIDCIDPHQGARVKLYMNPRSNTFEAIEDHLTFGGKAKDKETMDGLAILREVWHLFFDEPQTMDAAYSKPVNVPKSGHQGMVSSWEIKPGVEKPEVKVYVPLFQYFKSDRAIADSLEKAFRLRGWDWGTEGTYRNILADAFGKDTVDDKVETPLLHSYISFNFSQKKGAYMTAYVAPFIRWE